jgi:hypothetical protein
MSHGAAEAPLKRPRDEIVTVLVRVLGPSIGGSMVRASANGHWEKLGLGPVATDDECRGLLAALGPGLNVFVGRKRGEALMAEVITELRRSDSAS